VDGGTSGSAAGVMVEMEGGRGSKRKDSSIYRRGGGRVSDNIQLKGGKSSQDSALVLSGSTSVFATFSIPGERTGTLGGGRVVSLYVGGGWRYIQREKVMENHLATCCQGDSIVSWCRVGREGVALPGHRTKLVVGGGGGVLGRKGRRSKDKGTTLEGRGRHDKCWSRGGDGEGPRVG